MYKAQQSEGAAPGAGGETHAQDDVIDADFKEVGGDEKKK
jgi:molecular chaperone DnaK